MMNMKKSLYDISWQVTEPEYRADPALSYSTLARYDREGFRKLGSLFDRIDSPSLRFGSAVDLLITEGKSSFDARFIVCEFPSLSDNLVNIAKDLYNAFGKEYRTIDLIPDEHILAYSASYQPTWGNEAKLRNITSKCGDYYKLLAIAGDREILSNKDFKDAWNCVEELKENTYTKDNFKQNPFDTRFEKLFQVKFKGEYEGIQLRSMFDLIIVDHQEKIIYPKDLKTTGNAEEEFMSSFLHWRYMIQAQLYTYNLQYNISRDEYFKDFTIAPYEFIVINRFTLSPMVWKYNDNFAEVDMIGDDGKVYRNWRKIAKELNFYLNSSYNKYPVGVLQNKGIMTINNLRPK